MIAFEHIYLLFGIIAIAIPFLIHFIAKTRRKKINFPALFLFEKMLAKKSKLSKFSDIILMIVRVLLIFILVLIFAKPFIKVNDSESITDINSNEDKLYLFIIDDIYSTAYNIQPKTTIEVLKDSAIDFIEKLDNNAVFGLISFNNPDIKPYYSNDKSEIINRISFIKPNPETNSYIPDLLSKYIENLNNRKEREKNIVILSDFQKIDWHNVFDSVFIEKKHLENINNVFIKKLNTETFLNYSINNAYTPELLNYIGQPIDVFANIVIYKGNKAKKVNNIKVSALNGDNLISEQIINIDNSTTNDIKLSLKLFDAGNIPITLKLAYDKYEYDNYVNENICVIKNLNVYIANPDKDSITAQSLKSSIGTKYQSDLNLVTVDFERFPAKQYDVIIAYNITALKQEELNYIKEAFKKDKLIIILYSGDDDIYNMEKFIQDMGIDDLVLDSIINTKSSVFYPDLDIINEDNFRDLKLENTDIFFTKRLNPIVNNEKINTLLKMKDNS
ncbi:MAG: vWA domain-containing protein, partial [Spirochaetota bacterium]